MKDGDNLAVYLASEPSSGESESDAASAPVSAVVSDASSAIVSEGDGSDKPPQPPKDSEDDRPLPRPTFSSFEHQVPRAKPECCTEAWDQLEGGQSEFGECILPVCPLEFRNEVLMDVSAFDQPGYQTQTDPTTGATILPNQGNELLGGVVGVFWSCTHVTMTSCADKNTTSEMDFLRNFSQLVSLCPEGRTLMFKTHSKELVEEYVLP
jgi:hypothetical protein